MAKALTDAAIRKLKPHPRDRREIPDSKCSGLYLSIYPSGIKSFVLRYKRPGGGKSVRLTLGRWFEGSHEADNSSLEKELRAEIERLRAENKLLREGVQLPIAPIAPKTVQKKEPEIGDCTLSLSAARRLCAQLQDERKRGRDPASQRKLERTTAIQRADNTFAACAAQFIQEHMVQRADGERRPRGWKEAARILGLDYARDGRDQPVLRKGGLAQRWQDRQVGEIDAREIAAVVDESRRHGIPGLGRNNQGLSNSRGRQVFNALSTLYSWLQGEHRVAANPCGGLRRPKPPASRDRTLNCDPNTRSADEIRWFWHGCREIGQPWEPLLKCLLLTGCRRDELGQARWRELNDDRTVLHLPGSRTKNSRAFDLPLPPAPTELIKNIKPNGPYVFSFSGRTPANAFAKAKQRLDTAMLRLARKERGPDAKIEPWRLHDLRRTAATGMASLGVQPYVVEAVLNHVSGARAGIAGTYNVHAYEAEKRAALTKWAEHVERVVTGQSAKVTPIGSKRRN